MRKEILFTMIAGLFMSLSVMAHGPKKVNLTFDKATKTLKAEITHKVKDVKKHYISDIIIYINGDEVKTSAYDKQSDKLEEVLEFILDDVQTGDEIKLKAKCNKFGSKSSEITVE